METKGNVNEKDSSYVIKNNDTVFEISGKSPFGETLKLSQINTKSIYIDFWASWCNPCRKSHPKLVNAFSKLDSTKITFFSISLDEELVPWKKAIEKDKLSWKWHISDLKGWESNLANPFNIESIPSNILLDSNRKIIAKNIEPEILISYMKNK